MMVVASTTITIKSRKSKEEIVYYLIEIHNMDELSKEVQSEPYVETFIIFIVILDVFFQL